MVSGELIPCSSMVEQEAVNFEVVSSNLTGGAISKTAQRRIFYADEKSRKKGARTCAPFIITL